MNIDNRPSLLSQNDLVIKIGKMITGMKNHKNEKSTVENIRVLLGQKIISRMAKGEYLRNKFVEVFTGEDSDINEFAIKCLDKALDNYFSEKVEDAAIGQLMNSLYLSKDGHSLEVQTIIKKMAPFGWTAPNRHLEAA